MSISNYFYNFFTSSKDTNGSKEFTAYEQAKASALQVSQAIKYSIHLFRPFEGVLIGSGNAHLATWGPFISGLGQNLLLVHDALKVKNCDSLLIRAANRIACACLGVVSYLGGQLFYDGLRIKLLNEKKVQEALLLNLGSEFFVSGASFVASAFAIKNGVEILFPKQSAKEENGKPKDEGTCSSYLRILKGLICLSAGGAALIMGIYRAYTLLQGYQIASQMDLEQAKGVLLSDSLADLPGAKETNAVFIDGIDNNMLKIKIEGFQDAIKAWSHRFTKRPALKLLYQKAKVRYYEAGSYSRFLESLKEATEYFGGKIQNLALHGHGFPYAMRLGKTAFDISNSGTFFENIGKYLEKDSNLVLFSCSTAYPIDGFNLAQTFSYYMPHVNVYGNRLKADVTSLHFFFKDKKMQMNNFKGLDPFKASQKWVYHKDGDGTAIFRKYGYFKHFFGS